MKFFAQGLSSGIMPLLKNHASKNTFAVLALCGAKILIPDWVTQSLDFH